MTLQKPTSIAAHDFKSAKWDEITAGRSFKSSDIPTIELLCQWYLVVHQCIEDLDEFGTLIHIDDQDKPHSWPQLNTMKQASAEIRQLNKQLGICDDAQSGTEDVDGVSIINFAAAKRAQRRSRAAN